MFSINDTVKYGVNGICKIVDISNQSFCGTNAEYYVLKPISRNDSTFFVPTNNETLVSRMQKILSENDVYNLIGDIPNCNADWIDNDKLRMEEYSSIISSGTRREIIGLIRTLHLKKEQLENKNKKMHLADERIMKEAEKMISDEFATVLKIDPSEVNEFIEDKLADNL